MVVFLLLGKQLPVHFGQVESRTAARHERGHVAARLLMHVLQVLPGLLQQQLQLGVWSWLWSPEAGQVPYRLLRQVLDCLVSGVCARPEVSG
jgi:hypothetical protein